jgi:hypothetical protein
MQEFRNEWKYRLPMTDLAVIRERLTALLSSDRHSDSEGGYAVHSLYFDDFHDSCAKENDGGTAARFKYRIRFYNSYEGFLKLERKEKLFGMCRKKSAVLCEEQYRNIVSGNAEDAFWSTEDPVIRQFCVDIMTKGFAPKAIVDYERVAFVEPITNVRVTLDLNISASAEVDRFLNLDYLKVPLQKKGEHVLEVKFDDILPGYIRHAVTVPAMVQTAFSKYYFARNMIQTTGGF